MIMSSVIYIVAISFQLAGALLLLLYSISAKRENVIRRFASKCLIYRDNNTNEIQYDKEALKSSFRDAWLNKLSFGLIALGYLIGIFGEIGQTDKLLIFPYVVILTELIMFASYFMVICIIKYSSKVNKELSNDELNTLGIKPDIENCNNEELLEDFKDVLDLSEEQQ